VCLCSGLRIMPPLSRRTWHKLLSASLLGGWNRRPACAGTPQIDRAAVDSAIEQALACLSARQHSEGYWETEAWGESTGITSLAILAFLSAGYVPDEGPYGKQVSRGIRRVLSWQLPNGMLIRQNLSHGPLFDHGISSFMLAEICGMISGPDAAPARRALEQAIRLILTAQSVEKPARHQGGWRYQTDSHDSDLSVTAWQMFALQAARNAGCDIPAEAMSRAVAYVQSCADVRQHGFGYQPGNTPTPALTGAGIACLEVAGLHQARSALDAVGWLQTHPLQALSEYFYHGVFFTGIGLCLLGNEFARQHFQQLTQILLPLQRAEGDWPPRHGSEQQAGSIYSTSLAVLALTSDYRYLSTGPR